MTTIPPITEQDIRMLVGEQTFQQGQQYFQDEAIFDAYQQGMTLKAHCHGSLPQPYRVQVVFDTTDVTDAICTCSGNSRMPKGYYCKHIAALLLTWLKQPEKFTELPPVQTLLEQRSKAELISLITNILQKQPQLEWDLLMPAPTTQKRNKLVDPETYRSQVEAAFRNSGHEWGAVKVIANELFKIKHIGDGFLEQQDYGNATSVYEVIVMGILERYTKYPDVDGRLIEVINACIDAIDRYIFDTQDDKAIHQRCLHILFAIFRFSVDSGIDMGEEAPDVIAANVTAEERPTVADWVREALSQVEAADTYGSAEYHRQKYGKLLVNLESDELDDEAYLQICRETGRITDAVDRLLIRGRIEEATQEARQVDDYTLSKMTALFLEHGYDEAIERVIQERTRKTKNWRLLSWLKERYFVRKEYEAALKLVEIMFHAQPRLEEYQEMCQLATKLGRWEAMRLELLDFLKKSESTYVLIHIALDEGDIDQAVELLNSAEQRGYNYHDVYSYNDTALDVAKAAEATSPHAAIEIYQAYIERLIAQKNWGGYHEACEYLLKVRALYEKLGEHQSWMSYINDLRKRYSRLRSLKAEMDEAKLLS